MNSNIEETKNRLHKLIVETDDEKILTQVQGYFVTLKREKNIDWWDALPDTQKEIINKGLQQLENGERIPHDEVMRKAKKILNMK